MPRILQEPEFASTRTVVSANGEVVEVELTAEELAQRDKDEAEVAADEAANGYKMRRFNEYPTLGDQFDMIYKDKLDGGTRHHDAIAAVKAAHPKPE